MISITAPQSVAGLCTGLQDLFRCSGMTDSPLPPGIPVLQTEMYPGPPVPGHLPVCDSPLVMADNLITAGDWISWPVESSGWLEKLTEELVEHAGKKSVDRRQEGIFPPHAGIPLARSGRKDRIPDPASTGVSRILRNNPGWRALNLVCWNVEYLTSRPWYQSAAWYPIWRRRLRRAP